MQELHSDEQDTNPERRLPKTRLVLQHRTNLLRPDDACHRARGDPSVLAGPRCGRSMLSHQLHHLFQWLVKNHLLESPSHFFPLSLVQQ